MFKRGGVLILGIIFFVVLLIIGGVWIFTQNSSDTNTAGGDSQKGDSASSTTISGERQFTKSQGSAFEEFLKSKNAKGVKIIASAPGEPENYARQVEEYFKSKGWTVEFQVSTSITLFEGDVSASPNLDERGYGTLIIGTKKA